MLEQPFVKNPNRTIQANVDCVAAKPGDRVKIDQHIRFPVGEALNGAAAGSCYDT